MSLPDEPTEDDTERDGFLSYGAEWHALAHGVYNGMRSLRARPGELPDRPDVRAEPHYYKGGYVAGTVLQLAVVVAVGSQIGVAALL